MVFLSNFKEKEGAFPNGYLAEKWYLNITKAKGLKGLAQKLLSNSIERTSYKVYKTVGVF